MEESITEKEKIIQEKKKNEFLDWLLHIGIAVIVGVLIVTFVVQRTIVHDISMEPTLTEGDNLFVEKRDTASAGSTGAIS
jgi:signal peptidase I